MGPQNLGPFFCIHITALSPALHYFVKDKIEPCHSLTVFWVHSCSRTYKRCWRSCHSQDEFSRRDRGRQGKGAKLVFTHKCCCWRSEVGCRCFQSQPPSWRISQFVLSMPSAFHGLQSADRLTGWGQGKGQQVDSHCSHHCMIFYQPYKMVSFFTNNVGIESMYFWHLTAHLQKGGLSKTQQSCQASREACLWRGKQ